MADSASLSDGARQANLVSSEDAEIMFNADQAETHMVKLVDGKLVETGHTHADVSDDMPRIRLGSDEERALVGDDKKKYENSDAALRTGNTIDPSVMPDNPHAEAEITGNPDAGATVNTGLPSEHANTASSANDDAPNDRVQSGPRSANGEDMNTTATMSFSVTADMVPQTPSTPDPNNPVPTGPDTPVPPMSPDPAPEITPLPGTPQPIKPEIEEPGEPDRSHQIGFRFGQNNAVTSWPASESSLFTATITPTSADQLPITHEDRKAVPGTQYDGLSAGPDDVAMTSEDEGMDEHPETGDSTHPYDVRGDKDSSYQPGERPQETAQMMSQPTEAMDESSVKAGEATGRNIDRSETKSTDGLDRHYNDLDAEKDKTAY